MDSKQRVSSSKPTIREIVDGSYAVKAHTFALAAENSFHASNYKEASARHGMAHAYFDKVHDVVKQQGDNATAEALALLSSYHKTKGKEMKRRVKAAEEASSQRSKSPNTQANVAAPPISFTPVEVEQGKAEKPVGTSSVAAFSRVQKRFAEMKNLMSSSLVKVATSGSDPEERTSDIASKSMPENSNSLLLQRALGESFCVVPKTGGTIPKRTAHEDSYGDGNLTENLALGAEIQRLEQRIKYLLRENANLSHESQQLHKRLNQRNDDMVQMENFKKEYRRRFALLKLSMEHFQEAYAQGDHDGRRKVLEKKLSEAAQRIKYYHKKWETEREKRKSIELALSEVEEKLQRAESK
mmetsp:Transcript_9238/g.17446  ORF Transcript_9238/g.17446 Transcript_9238/m.17446 type:complete len:355 (-) Transcript_9238:2091-3155(-)